MKVFISWSGEASRTVAEVLRRFLPYMIQELKPFMSQHDLSSGGRWSEQLSKELEQAKFGVICLTPDNLQEPWILFEAGALTKHVEGRACCLLLRGLGQADVSGPLSQFQNRSFSHDDFYKLLSDLNNLLDTPLEKSNLQIVFDKWWPDLENEVNATLENQELISVTEHKRDQSDILEELLLRVRNIQRNLEDKSRSEPVLSWNEATTVRDVLERVLSRLSPSQKALLQELVTPAGTLHMVSLNELETKYGKADIEALLRGSLVRRHDDGLMSPMT